MNITTQRYIVQYDPGYIRTTTDGHYVLQREDDDGVVREVTMTPEQYDEHHRLSVEEEFFALTAIAMNEISGTQITPTSVMVDVLLDARALFTQAMEQNRKMVRLWYSQAVKSGRVADFYYEKFGEVDIPEDWEPAWLTESDEDFLVRVTADS